MLTLIPAYGRDYTSAKSVRADWDSGKDFIVANFFDPADGKPCNKPDLERDPANYRWDPDTWSNVRLESK